MWAWQETVIPVWVAWPEDQGRKGPDGHALSSTGVPQVNEVVFSPSESHCATCGEDGSVRVWSLASMELVIQFQVLNQVGGKSRGKWCMFRAELGSCALLPCAEAGASVASLGKCWLSSLHGTLELPLPCLDPPILWTPRAAAGGGRLQRWHTSSLQHLSYCNGTQDAPPPDCSDSHCLLH